jgi:hypothetical protein
MAFFSNFGVAYTAASSTCPASTGYWRSRAEALQVEGRREDRPPPSVSIRVSPRRSRRRRKATCRRCKPSRHQRRLRDALLAAVVRRSEHAVGRRYARTAEGAEVVSVGITTGEETVIAATSNARAMLSKADEINFLSGPAAASS